MARCYTGPPKVPTFNLTADVWINFAGLWVYPPIVAKSYSVAAQLTPGERVYGINAVITTCFILVPKLTDVHFNRGTGNPDYIEIPAGSGRVYQVWSVEDVGKGFLNEYRQVLGTMVPPYPVPLT